MFMLPVSLFKTSVLIWDLLCKIQNREYKIYWPGFSGSNNHALDKPHWLLHCHCAKLWSGFWILIFFVQNIFFYHLLIYFHVKHPISALHINHASFEALKLVFWFSVGKDKIHVGCCWNKMYILESGILLWFLSFFYTFFGSNCQIWDIAFVLFAIFKSNWSL